MDIFTYDCEVMAYDFLVVFKNFENGEYTVFHNNDELKSFINSDDIYVGFNSKYYDQYIIKAIAGGMRPEEVKQVNDWMIADNPGWECPYLQGIYFKFNNVDIMDDMQMGLSLKAIEGHLGMSIEESSVDFNNDRPLTEEELEETIHYCKHDVDTTETLVKIRQQYLLSKMQVGRMAKIPDEKALAMTNAKLTAALLGANAREWKDERDYEYPPNLCREYIPPEVIEFFDRMHDKTIPDDVLFKSKLNLMVQGCPAVLAYGGIHAAIPNYRESVHGTRTIRNYDVASLYPSLMIKCGYTSRNIPSAQAFEDVYTRRLTAKKSGDKSMANALKLVLNTTYGAMLNRYNDLYDPRMGRSVCVSGQLFILELARRYVLSLKTVKLIQLNTDGLMVSLEKSELPTLYAINEEWQKRTGFTLEEDMILQIIQKDVNNYVMVKDDGKVKCKGGYLVRGIAPAGAFNINNNATIVADAIREYFVHGTPVEETINGCKDILAFQQIAKSGTKYRESYHIVDGQQVPIQRVNRVYATKDERYGKLYKVKAESDMTAKIEMLPEHCIIDNENKLSVSDIDKTFYIEMAKKRINDFLGVQPEKKGRKKKMADNLYKRLARVRDKFREAGVQKGGKNMQLKSMYFELDDIVPVAMPLFHEEGMIPITSFDKDLAILSIVDFEDPKESINFTAPVREWTGNAAVTPVQAWGATETYMRRYLYMIALDIVEADTLENRPDPDRKPVNLKPNKPAEPATPEKREEVKKELTAPGGNASELQIKRLKAALKKLKEKDPSKEDFVVQIALKTKSFKEISKESCEKLLTQVSELLTGGNA